MDECTRKAPRAMKQLFTMNEKKVSAPYELPEPPGSMKQLFILLWILWANMLWIFGVPSIYLARLGDWRAFVSIPLFLFTLYAGWRLFLRSRREWRQSA